MAIKKLKQTSLIHGEFYELEGVIAPDKTSKEGETLTGVRKFLYQGSKVAMCISFHTYETIGKRKVRKYIDVLCFREDQFDEILALNLSDGDRVAVFARCSQKENGKFSFIVDEAEWVTAPASI